MLGIFRKGAEGGRIVPIDKGADKEWRVAAGATHGAKDGELVEAEQAGPKGRMGLPRARIVDRLGDPTAPARRVADRDPPARHSRRLPRRGDRRGRRAKPAGLGKREDLRDLPLITIDPADARDHDDACLCPGR